jgi:hypothetical protein
MLPFAVMTRSWIGSLPLALAASVATRSVSAAEPEAPAPAARLEVAAGESCTSRQDLMARVRARAPRVRFRDEGDAIEIRAEFAEASASFVTGSVVLVDRDGRQSVRRVLGSSCSDAANAVALIIAVTLDPTAVLREGGAGKGETSPVGSGDDETPAAVAREPAKSDAASQRVVPNPPRAPGRNSLSVQVAAQALLGPAPKIMPGVALYVMVGIERPALWSPAVLLGASHAWRTGIDEEGGTAAFTLDAASFDACPLRLRWGPFEARPCGSVLIGRLSARGSQTRNPATESGRPFWVIGGAALATGDLSELFQLTARAAVGGNLVRDSFVFTPKVFHEVPAVTAEASLGIGMRWR